MAAPEFKFTLIKRFWQFLIGGTIAVFLVFILVSFGLFGEMPDVEDLENPKNALSSEILGDDGTLMGSFYLENRINTAHKDIAPCVFNALEATEDVRFRGHSGIDIRGTIRAVAALGQDGGASFHPIVILGGAGGKHVVNKMAEPLLIYLLTALAGQCREQ